MSRGKEPSRPDRDVLSQSAGPVQDPGNPDFHVAGQLLGDGGGDSGIRLLSECGVNFHLRGGETGRHGHHGGDGDSGRDGDDGGELFHDILLVPLGAFFGRCELQDTASNT